VTSEISQVRLSQGPTPGPCRSLPATCFEAQLIASFRTFSQVVYDVITEWLLSLLDGSTSHAHQRPVAWERILRIAECQLAEQVKHVQHFGVTSCTMIYGVKVPCSNLSYCMCQFSVFRTIGEKVQNVKNKLKNKTIFVKKKKLDIKTKIILPVSLKNKIFIAKIIPSCFFSISFIGNVL